MPECYDAVILGGGPAAHATALSLRLQGDFSVLMIDAGSPVRERAGESAPPDLLRPLRQLRLADEFLSDGHDHSPGSAVMWGRDEVGYNDHLLNPMGPVWRLNRRVFDRMLTRAATDRGVVVRWDMRYAGISADPMPEQGHRLMLSDANGNMVWVQAGWVVDATGPLARFAGDMGISRRVDDRLVALACFSTVLDGDSTMQTLVESVSDGWWYAARLPGRRIVTMLVTDAAMLRRVARNAYGGWETALNSTRLISPSLAGLRLINPAFHTFPVYSSLLGQVTGSNWLAAGDAASCYDPIASQGLYKALSDGQLAGRAIAGALGNQPDLPDSYATGVRERYEQYYLNRCHLYGQEQRWKNSAFWIDRWKADRGRA